MKKYFVVINGFCTFIPSTRQKFFYKTNRKNKDPGERMKVPSYTLLLASVDTTGA